VTALDATARDRSRWSVRPVSRVGPPPAHFWARTSLEGEARRLEFVPHAVVTDAGARVDPRVTHEPGRDRADRPAVPVERQHLIVVQPRVGAPRCARHCELPRREHDVFLQPVAGGRQHDVGSGQGACVAHARAVRLPGDGVRAGQFVAHRLPGPKVTVASA
jgi:hypothetical protein